MVLEIPGGIFGQSDVRETPTSDLIGQAVPVGAILAWLKTLAGCPALPAGFVECAGQVLNDGDSPFDGQTIPDLNGGEFLRGDTTSGGTGGGTTGAGTAHTHTQNGSVSSHTLTENEIPSHTHTTDADNIGTNSTRETTGSFFSLASRANGTIGNTGGGAGHDHNDTFSNANESAHTHASQPKYYNVVWIMRIK